MTTLGVREEGDLTKAPYLPHALGLEKFTLADSPLPPGVIPRNVTEKDFIRQVGGFKGSSDRFGLHLKPRDRRTRSFETQHQTFAHELLDQEIHKLKAAQRNERGHDDILQDSIETMALQTVSGPREHPTYILESEAVRQNMGLQTADSIVRTLATLPSAPTAEPSQAEHHFLFGGSKKQKRKLDRKIRNAQKIVEANVALRKEQLVQSNLQTLQDMYAQAETRINLSAAGNQGVISNETGSDQGTSGSPMASAAAAGAACRSCSETPAAAAKTNTTQSSLPIIGLGLGIALIVVVLAIGHRKKL